MPGHAPFSRVAGRGGAGRGAKKCLLLVKALCAKRTTSRPAGRGSKRGGMKNTEAMTPSRGSKIDTPTTPNRQPLSLTAPYRGAGLGGGEEGEEEEEEGEEGEEEDES